MSQFEKFFDGTVLPDVETLTPDVGGAVGADAAFNINLTGGNNITTTGTPAANDVTIDVTGTTDHTVQVGNATGSLTSLGAGTDGQVLIGDTGADPAFATITSGDGSITFTPGAATLDMSSLGTSSVDQVQVYYVGKHGNDANSGLNEDEAVLTFGQALTLATAALPTAVNPIAIVCLDDGIYTENITCVEYVNIHAPNAQLTGNIIGIDNCSVKFRAQSVATGNVGISKVAGAGYFFCDIDDIDLAGTASGFVITSGYGNLIWKRMTVANGFGIGDITSVLLHTHVKGGDIYVTGTGTAIARANAGTTVGRIDHLIDTGGGNGRGVYNVAGTTNLVISDIQDFLMGVEVDAGTANLNVQELSSTTAYDIANGATLNLFVNSLAGTETVGATGIRRLWRCDGSSYFPGDLTISRDTAGAGTVQETISNIDNTATASSAALNLSVGGTTSTGDPYVNWLVTGGGTFSAGIDNSDSDNWKLTTGATPSAGTELIEIEADTTNMLINILDVAQTMTNAGGYVSYRVTNSDDTNAASYARLGLTVGGSNAGDPYIQFVIGADSWSLGADNSDSDKFKLVRGGNLAGTEIFNVTTAGVTSFTQGNVTVQRSASGSTVSGNIRNSNNDAAESPAALNISVGGSTNTGDPYVNWLVTGGGTFSAGIDNSDSDIWKLTTGATPSAGTTLWQMTTAGERTIPTQPAFLAYLAADANDKTGAGTAYTLGTDALTEVYDQNADFNVNGTLTAPVTGKYDLKANISIIGTTIATTFVISIVTLNRTYTHTYTRAAGATDQSMFLSCLADMDAADTATVTITVTGEGADTDDIDGGASCLTYFCGALIC